ncbi:translation elongation factor Ts [Desulfomonile tiedjei]|uniref:Elongation factor Ts n=1 Tax=Desulfomonile tiedjei (strain ATCC 49306 / DSM 6799 / DCB-1) TaxID=706587 RepID=I4CAM4_DESTA|nr:translation elongation factor Ts [Desulfomonile tiedjei]AFM26615.1 translation elongation factor Ts (EF-Ts) [Desulfomonile tiedjei DSM 6799]
MQVTAQMVKELREKTGLGMMDCKKALSETAGDLDAAVDYLRKKGALKAAKREGRATSEGRIGSYIHMNGKIGVLVELNCESDFVAKTDQYAELVKDLCMHVAASSPRWISSEDVPEEVLAKEKEIYMTQAKEAGKPDKMLEKIAEGKLNKFFSEVCLLNQPFVKDPDKTVDQLIKEKIGQLGENITVGRFVRFQLGESK